MNTLVLVVIGILIIYTLLGYRAGLIKTVFSICSMIVALILTLMISPHISKAMQSNEKIVTYFSEKVENVLNLDESFNQSVSDSVSGIDKLPLPKTLKDSLIKNKNAQTYDALGVTNFSEYISHSLARIVINALSFIGTFVLLLIGLRILCKVLDVISKLPVLNQINKFTGFVAGFAKGLIVLWLLCIALIMFSGTQVGKACFEMINESTFLGIIYNNNVILYFITKVII